ncbi:MAG: ketol-acid reductoisomerase, partial [Acidobacteria bacterium]|nr:ketol-acid reductoisomerase [Acidobacteriota bacterium]
MYRGGLSYMRYSVSDTAEYGDYTGVPRIVTAETKAEMKRILEEIQDGRYAKAWIEENRTGRPWFEAQRKAEQAHIIEKVGKDLRRMMPFLDPVEVPGA